MARKTDRDSVIEHTLGSLGLLLLGLTGWAVERLQGRAPIGAILARLVLGCVTAVGWTVDRLPLPDPHRRDRADGTKSAHPSSDIRERALFRFGGRRIRRVFQISASPRDKFAPLFARDDAQLRAMGEKRYLAVRHCGFPCRVSLQDAAPGEHLVPVPFTHQSADSPGRASGPIFGREAARQASLSVNDVPEQLRVRLLSVRAYDADALLVDADVVNGREPESVVERLFNDPRVQYLHVHFARPGCYACRIDRA